MASRKAQALRELVSTSRAGFRDAASAESDDDNSRTDVKNYRRNKTDYSSGQDIALVPAVNGQRTGRQSKANDADKFSKPKTPDSGIETERRGSNDLRLQLSNLALETNEDKSVLTYRTTINTKQFIDEIMCYVDADALSNLLHQSQTDLRRIAAWKRESFDNFVHFAHFFLKEFSESDRHALFRNEYDILTEQIRFVFRAGGQTNTSLAAAHRLLDAVFHEYPRALCRSGSGTFLFLDQFDILTNRPEKSAAAEADSESSQLTDLNEIRFRSLMTALRVTVARHARWLLALRAIVIIGFATACFDFFQRIKAEVTAPASRVNSARSRPATAASSSAKSSERAAAISDVELIKNRLFRCVELDYCEAAVYFLRPFDPAFPHVRSISIPQTARSSRSGLPQQNDSSEEPSTDVLIERYTNTQQADPFWLLADEQGRNLAFACAAYNRKRVLRTLLSRFVALRNLLATQAGSIASLRNIDVNTVRRDFVNCVCSNGNSPLHAAVNSCSKQDSQLDVLQMLIDAEALINIANAKCDSATPLHIAVMLNAPQIVNLLVQSGADKSAKMTDNSTPVDLARVFSEDSLPFLLGTDVAEVDAGAADK